MIVGLMPVGKSGVEDSLQAWINKLDRLQNIVLSSLADAGIEEKDINAEGYFFEVPNVRNLAKVVTLINTRLKKAGYKYKLEVFPKSIGPKLKGLELVER